MAELCIVVSRGGWGEAWLHDSRQAALDHPLTQDGDAIVESAEDVLDCWNPVFLARMFEEVLGDRSRAEQALAEIQGAATSEIRHMRCVSLSSEAWTSLRRLARRPPREPRVLLDKITEDRRLHTEWHNREQTRRSSPMTAAAAAEKTEKPKDTHGKFPHAHKITLGKDKEGKPYHGKDNNPKRPNSKSHAIFAKYKDGMTVKQAAEAGIPAADLKWDSEHGFISIG